MDQAWYKDVDDNVKKIEKAMGLQGGPVEMGKAQECAMLYVLKKHNSYFNQNFTKEDVGMMEQNIRDDSSLFDGFHGPVSMIKTLREETTRAKEQRDHESAKVLEAQAEVDDLKSDYQGAIQSLQNRIAELQVSKLRTEGDWETAIARAEKAEVENELLRYEIIKYKIRTKEELDDEERELVLKQLPR